MTNRSRRVVITGMGVVSPFGVGLDTLWENLIQGNSGIKTITQVDLSQHDVKFGGECSDFDPAQYLDKKEVKRMDRYTQLAMVAAQEAAQHAGLDMNKIDPTRVGVIVGSASGGMATIEKNHLAIIEKGPAKCSPFTVPMMIVDIAAGRISIMVGAKGPNKAIVTACATASHCLGDAFRAIMYGDADIILAGGCEAPLTSLAIAGFTSARTLSRRNDAPQKASRPFDKDRDGFVMAEGAGIFVLEELEHAKARGAKIYGEFAGYAANADANDIVAPCPDGDGAARAMVLALKDANLKPEDIQYINTHGTSTDLGDVAETLAIKRVFGDYAKNGLLVSSTKSMTGHALGAAGAIEAAACIKAMETGIIPPTINLDNPDELCDLDYVPHKARKLDKVTAVMSNSFGFGGHNASLVFKKYE
ncbi:MAG: beta-ketoacyl-[acyl-carrier-protein] synthase II [Candidatus Melainabacteria bacterium GWF2_37_15]|nr:MAG: beta-ketoacyl-[acyl-carrier-protein] synthase II [Candidatus Melainabacteria bacterium GWF2_37_15]